MERSEKFALFTVLFAIIAAIAIMVLVPDLAEKPIQPIAPSVEEPEKKPSEAEPSEVKPAEPSKKIEEPKAEEPPIEEEPKAVPVTGETLEELLSKCADKKEGTQKDYCLKNLALEKNNSALCNHLTIFSIDECLHEVALNANDANACKGIDSNSLRDDCYHAIALSESDAELCKKLSRKSIPSLQKRDSCFKTIAENTTNPSYCRFISLSQTNGHFFRDDCYWNIMVELNDSSLCDKLYSSKRQQDCFSYFGEKISEIEEFSLSICENLTDLNRVKCFKNLAVKDNNYLLCSYLKDANYNECMHSLIPHIDENTSQKFCEEILWLHKDECNSKMALEKQDANLCSKMFDKSEREDCYYELAIKTSNASLCKELEKRAIYSPKKNDCFKKIAFNSKDANICENIEMSQKYFNCYYELAIDLESYTVCMLIKKFTHIYSYSPYPLQQMCYKNYGVEKNNLLACNEIISPELKQACIGGNVSFGVK